MADTHINAYFADVEDKRRAAEIANGELQAAEAALAAKKREVGFVEQEPEQAPEPEVEPAKPTGFKKK